MEMLQDTSFNLAFLHGDAGVGKGTLAKGLLIELPKHGINIVHISSGDLLREVEKVINNQESSLSYIDKIAGLATKTDIDAMRRRELVRSETVLSMVFAAIAHNANMGMDVGLLDAVSRTIPQHEAYKAGMAVMSDQNRITRLDILIDTLEHIKLERLFGRKEGRSDDGDIKEQKERYHRIKQGSDPMLAQIRMEIAAGVLDSEFHTIDALGTPDQVLAAAVEIFLQSDRVSGHYPNNGQYTMHHEGGVLVPNRRTIVTPNRQQI